MTKYPLIRLFAEGWNNLNRPTTPAKRVEPKQSRQAAQQAIMDAKQKRERKRMKRAAAFHNTTVE